MIEGFSELPISEEEAFEKARKILRERFGSLVGIENVQREGTVWKFKLVTAYPKVIFDYSRTPAFPIKVKKMRPIELGWIEIDGMTGEPKFPKRSTIVSKIKDRLIELQNTVEKALVKAESKKFSKIPFSEHRWTPILDIFSKLLISDRIDLDELSRLSNIAELKYMDYLQTLEELNLVIFEGDSYVSGDLLLKIEAKDKPLSEKLSDAMELFFRLGYEKLDKIQEILGPHLKLSASYYAIALQSEQLPKISKKFFIKKIYYFYTSTDRNEKLFKLDRYLIQLESIGLLEYSGFDGDSYWKGLEDVYKNLLKEDEILEPIKDII